MRPARTLAIALFVFVLAGCGGGGDGALTGRFVDGSVSGIAYATDTQSGITDAAGTFRYLPGETVRFSLGATRLGEAPGQEVVTPFDIRGTEPVTGNEAVQRALSENGGPYRAALNVARLLQTFDWDGDPSNGIEIRPEVATLFEGEPVKLQQSTWRFRTERSFRRRLNEANARGVLSEHRTVPPRWLVAAHLYESLDLEPAVWAITRTEEDLNGDGLADWTYARDYDARGYPVREESRTATSRTVSDAVYDDAGRMLRSEYDSDGDGTPDEVRTYEYDSDANLTQILTDTDRDGTPDKIQSYAHNEFGQQIRFESIDFTTVPTRRRVKTYEYDARGNEVIQTSDRDGDGLVDQTWTQTYDTDDNQTSSISTGSSNYSDTHAYDAHGNRIRSEYDEGNDGSVERILIYERNADGKLVREELVSNVPGVPSSVTRYTLDVRGNAIRSETDVNRDDTIDAIAVWEYDTRGNLLRYAEDDNNDAVFDQVETSFYDANGNQVEWRREDAMGVRTAHRTYTENGWYALLQF